MTRQESHDGPTYAIGIEHKPNSFGMTHGPTPNLGEMLKVCPEPNACLFRYTNGGDEEILFRAEWFANNWIWVAQNTTENDL